jgi:hypothetical protein
MSDDEKRVIPWWKPEPLAPDSPILVKMRLALGLAERPPSGLSSNPEDPNGDR